MRRLLKFLHTLGAVGLMGAMACFLVALTFAPPPAALDAQVALMGAMGRIATWVFLPSLALTLIAGLLSMAVNPGFHDVGWVWIKAGTGILVFEGGFTAVIGPIQAAAKAAAGAAAGHVDPAVLARAFGGERLALWALMGVALANVALGVWRPRMPQIPV